MVCIWLIRLIFFLSFLLSCESCIWRVCTLWKNHSPKLYFGFSFLVQKIIQALSILAIFVIIIMKNQESQEEVLIFAVTNFIFLVDQVRLRRIKSFFFSFFFSCKIITRLPFIFETFFCLWLWWIPIKLINIILFDDTSKIPLLGITQP